MNGELFQICSIVASAKYALKSNVDIDYEMDSYVKKIEFQFLEIHSLPKKFFFRLLQGSKEKNQNYVATSVNEWYKQCKKHGLADIKYLTPTGVKDRGILGFSNSNWSSIVCFFDGGEVTYFAANWTFDEKNKAWIVVYKEYLWENPPVGKPHFEDNTDEFKKILNVIADFACIIKLPIWKDVFDKPVDMLEGTFANEEKEWKMHLPNLPEKHMRLFLAASNADVFGAMGSWNDSPPYCAHEMGLDKKYDDYSDELLKQVRLATLFAINEW